MTERAPTVGLAPDQKQCSRCHEVKHVDYFGKWRTYCRECHRRQHRDWYAANRERVLADIRSQRAANPVRSRRPKAFPAEWAGYASALQADPCAYCGGPGGTLDHIVPRTMGGGDEWENATSACGECNRTKNRKPLLLFLAHRNGCYEWRRDLR